MALGSFGSTEILQIADAVSREKGINKEAVISAMEESIAIAARKKYGYGRNLKARINKDSGEINLYRQLKVVETIVEDEEQEEDHSYEANYDEDGNRHVKPEVYAQILLEDALVKNAESKVGDIIEEPLPPIDLGRVAAQTAKQVIIQKVREAERERQYEDFKDRIGEVVNGVVKRVEFGNVIVDLGRAEAILKKDSLIRGESFRTNERIRALLKDVRRENKGPQLFLSRTAPEFMEKLFTQEVPEIYDGLITVKSIAREPGSRAKIAVFSGDSNIDPVGSCVGVRGSRVQAIINELQGEKIDIIEWSEDPATYVIRALSPAEVSKVIIDEENNKIEVVVAEDQLSLAIGRKGQNVRLASELTGWNIDICSEDEESTRRIEEFNKSSKLFMEALNVEEIIAQLLASEGFANVDEILEADVSELANIEGFNEEVAVELQGRAREYVEQQKGEFEKIVKKHKIADDLVNFNGINKELLVALAEKGIRSLDDFADLSHEDFEELIPDSSLSGKEIDALIMKAREHWFADDAKDKEEKEAKAKNKEHDNDNNSGSDSAKEQTETSYAVSEKKE